MKLLKDAFFRQNMIITEWDYDAFLFQKIQTDTVAIFWGAQCRIYIY